MVSYGNALDIPIPFINTAGMGMGGGLCQTDMHQNGSTTLKANVGPRRPTQANHDKQPSIAGPQQPTTAITSPYAATHTWKCMYNYSYTRFLYILFLLFLFYIFYFSCNIY